MIQNIVTNVFSDMEAPIVFLIVAMGLRIVNIILGSTDAMFKKDFDWGYFFSGIEKMGVVSITILFAIVLLNLFTYGLSLIDVQIPTKGVSAMETILIIVTWCVDLSIEVAEKIKAQKELKYVKYEDIQINPQTEEGIG